MASFGIGAALRQQRIRQNFSLDDIARQTRISPRFLQAIEADEFERLPGLVFTRNFVRQYADAVDLDSEPLLAELPRPDLASARLPDPPGHHEPRWDPRWNSAIASLVWFSLAVGATVGAYVHFNRPAQIREGTASANTSAPASVQPPPTAAPKQLEVKPIAETTPKPVEPDSEPAAEARAAHNVHVVITARQTAWIQAIADSKTAFTGTLQPNDSRTIDADDAVKIIAGNAGGLSVSLNGKDLDPLGPSGQVRVVRLTAEGLQLPAKIPPPADPL